MLYYSYSCFSGLTSSPSPSNFLLRSAQQSLCNWVRLDRQQAGCALEFHRSSRNKLQRIYLLTYCAHVCARRCHAAAPTQHLCETQWEDQRVKITCLPGSCGPKTSGLELFTVSASVSLLLQPVGKHRWVGLERKFTQGVVPIRARVS